MVQGRCDGGVGVLYLQAHGRGRAGQVVAAAFGSGQPSRQEEMVSWWCRRGARCSSGVVWVQLGFSGARAARFGVGAACVTLKQLSRSRDLRIFY